MKTTTAHRRPPPAAPDRPRIPRGFPARALARLVGDARSPVDHIRRLFLLLALTAYAATSLPTVWWSAGTPTDRAAAAAVLTLLAGWAWRLHRAGRPRPAGDVLVAGGLVALTLATGTPPYGVLFASLWLRALHGSGRTFALATVVYLVGYDVGLALAHGPAALTAPATVGLRLGVVLSAAVIGLVARTLRDYERHLEVGEILTRAGERLVASEDRAHVCAAALEALDALTASFPVSGHGQLWLLEGAHLERAAATAEQCHRGVDRVALSAVPAEILTTLEAGRGLVLGAEEAQAVERRLGLEPRCRAAALAPICPRGTLGGLFVVASEQDLPEDLVYALERLSLTVGLALERREADERFRSVVHNLWDTIAILNVEGQLEYVSPSIRRLLGYAAVDLVGAPARVLLHPDDKDLVPVQWSAIDEARSPIECRLRHVDGSWRTVEITGSRLVEPSAPPRLVLVARDISERRALEDEVTYRAFHDAVTDLPNRSLFIDRAAQALGRARRSGRLVALAFVDLDDFKTVNDSLGHRAGDALLRTAARRLQEATRETDTVARLGGDEFGLLFEDLRDREEAVALCERALSTLEQPCRLEGREVGVHASGGVVVADGSERDVGRLLRDADLAMYAAKDAGKARVALFDPAMHRAAVSKLELRSELRAAFARDEFELVYQPVIRLADQRITAFEALLRWRHPQRGLLAPAAFLPLAEEDGLIVPLGRWVVAAAVRQLARLRACSTGPAPLAMCVNLSAEQLTDQELIPAVHRALAEAGVPASALILEITETAMMRDVKAARAVLDALRGAGMRIAVDDFGNGYSSLSYLRDFPLDFLKVDRSFISRIDAGPEEGALAHAIVKLADNLGLAPIAEGVERSEQADILRRWGCAFAQGYLFARPVDAEAALELVVSETAAGGATKVARNALTAVAAAAGAQA